MYLKKLEGGKMMNYYQELKERYENKGLDNYLLRDIEDIKDIYNIDIPKLKGYNKLEPSVKDFFNKMIVNYYNARGLEARDDLKPKKVIIRDGKLAFYHNDMFNYFYSNGTWG